MLKAHFVKRLFTSDGEIDLDLDFEIEKSQMISIFGKSGAGKTTILRMLAGLSMPDAGRLVVNGKTWFDAQAGIQLPTQERRIGFVFQNYALFPNMTVYQNLEYAAKNKKKIHELLELTGLQQLMHRKPDSLSGGQKQRVALARALMLEPDLLLLDEALSALDFETRQELQNEILEINDRYKTTIVFVSHDLSEIFKLSTKTMLLNKGQIIQYDSPAAVFANDQLSAKFQFVGEILAIQPSDVVFVIRVLIGNNIIQVIATEQEADNLAIGEKVIVASKAFNPVIEKLSLEKQPTRIKNTWFH